MENYGRVNNFKNLRLKIKKMMEKISFSIKTLSKCY